MAGLLTVNVDVHGIDEVKETIRDALDRADKAEAKLKKYRWHDLRNNPEDLPRNYLHYERVSDEIKISFDKIKIIYMDKYKQITEHATGINGKYKSLVSGYEIIAWKFLEPFEVEEDE